LHGAARHLQLDRESGHRQARVLAQQREQLAVGVVEVDTGYPLLLSELTLTTALRTAATSALAARRLARPGARRMALIGNGAQSEFQAQAFHTLLGIDEIRAFDLDPAATAKLVRNLAPYQGLRVMRAASTAQAVRGDVIEMLKAEYRVQDVIDYSRLAQHGLFLEGTGAMVLDHVASVAYTARSQRADPVALERFRTHFNFEPMTFTAADDHGRAIYHINVMMCVATEFALVGFELMDDAQRRAEVRARLAEGGRTVIALDARQIGEFAGNALELSGAQGRVLALSSRAAASLRPEQRAIIERIARLSPLAVPTIELAGGSALHARRHPSGAAPKRAMNSHGMQGGKSHVGGASARLSCRRRGRRLRVRLRSTRHCLVRPAVPSTAQRLAPKTPMGDARQRPRMPLRWSYS
jgi:hypothetical protein